MLKKQQIIIGLIVALALFLRLFNLGNFEITGDEGNYALRGIGWNDFMVSTTMQTPWNWFVGEKLPIWTQLSFFDHPPLHFATIWLSSHLFGVNLLSIRLPAVIFGILTILIIILILFKIASPKAAYISGIFLAILPWHIWLSRQAQQESLLIFLICLLIYLVLTNKDKILNWVLIGLVIGMAFLTKYSAIIIIPLIIWWLISKKWYLNKKFYLALVISLIICLPVIIYNFKLYQLKGHFDLQFARILQQDISQDWPANVQMIHQGKINDFKNIPWLLIQWFSSGGLIIVLAGLFKSIKENKNNIFLSYGMTIISILVAGATLFDPIRASVILPFLVISFGLAIYHLPEKLKLNLILPTIVLILLLPATFNIYKDINKWPDWLAGSFRKSDQGFINLEKWLTENQRPILKPLHFNSINDWAQRIYELILETKQPIIIFDNRFNWQALNWHILRHTFYTTNYPALTPDLFFNFLLSDIDLIEKIEGKEFIYIQAVKTDIKKESISNEQLKIFDRVIQDLIELENKKPEIITNREGDILAKIWLLKFNKNLEIIY